MRAAEFIHIFQIENNLNYRMQCFDISKKNDESRLLIDVCSKDDKFDGMQIYLENGVYEVSEMVPDTHINVFCETKSFKIALKYLFRGNKQKIKKVIHTK